MSKEIQTPKENYFLFGIAIITVCILILLASGIVADDARETWFPKTIPSSPQKADFKPCTITEYGRGVLYFECDRESDFGTTLSQYMDTHFVSVEAIAPVPGKLSWSYWVAVVSTTPP